MNPRPQTLATINEHDESKEHKLEDEDQIDSGNVQAERIRLLEDENRFYQPEEKKLAAEEENNQAAFVYSSQRIATYSMFNHLNGVILPIEEKKYSEETTDYSPG
jgi:hypothetical protein